MKIAIVGIICLLVGSYVGWLQGSYYANMKSFEIGYDLGFNSAIMPGATVVDTSTGKKYKITEVKEERKDDI